MSMNMGPPGGGGVSDEEIAEAHAKVRAHQWKERMSMGVAMLVAIPFFIAGVIFSWLLWIPGVMLGGAVWKALRPKKTNPLDHI